MIIDVIKKAKITLIENNVPEPYYIHLSTSAHDFLVSEINQRDGMREGKYSKRVFEIAGMKVEIDPRCPQRGAYIIGGDQK